MLPDSRAVKAYLGPFLVFLSFMFVTLGVQKLGEGLAFWAWSDPQYWVFPLQTVVTGAVLAGWWKYYALRWPTFRQGRWAAGVGVLAFVLWIAPQQWFGSAPRVEGYRPTYFSDPPLDGALLALRFLRLVVVVPLAEEIFWRGFLMRWLVEPRFTAIPVGTWGARAFWITTAGFCLEHQLVDWPAAALTGMLYGVLALKTRSLTACVLAHSLTNLLLGLWIMRTGQWGFW